MKTTTQNIDRLPPHSLELEQAVLGCILLDPPVALTDLAERFANDFEVFYDLRHQEIFTAILILAAENLPIDTVTVLERLRARGTSEQCGGAPYLAALPDAAPIGSAIGYYAEQLGDLALRRKIIRVCTQIIQDCYEPSLDLETVLSNAEKAIMSIRRQRRDQTPSVAILVDHAIEEIERRHRESGAITGLSTGFFDLDALTDGLHPGELVVIAGWPGAGKSTLAMNLAEHVAIALRMPVGVFSLEMSAPRLVMRLLSSRGRLNLKRVGKGILTPDDFPRLATAAGEIKRAPFYFCDLSDLTIAQLRAQARRMAQSYGIKLLVIDYLQLLTAPGRKEQSREQEVSNISRGIKMMACELDIPVLALSQLNEDGKLRESRSIGQDADGVWALKPKENQDLSNDAITMELELRKQRDGQAPAKVNLLFQKTHLRFENLAL